MNGTRNGMVGGGSGLVRTGARPRPWRRAVLVALLGLLLPFPAAADASAGAPAPGARDLGGLSLEQLMDVEVETVSGASRYEQKVTEAPAAITVVTAEDIRTHGYRTLAELLRDVRGMYTTSDRNYDYVGARGFGRMDDYNARVLLLVDGHRENDDLYEAAAIGTDLPVDMELVERVEIVRGPSSSVYGTNAFLAVINVVTKSGATAGGPRAVGEVASLGTRRGEFSYGVSTARGLDLLVAGSLYASDGEARIHFPEFDSPLTHDGVAERSDGDRAGRVFANASYGDFRLQSVWGRRTKVVPTASWGTLFDDPRNKTVDTRGWADLSWHHRLPDRTELIGRLSFDGYDYRGDYPYEYSSDPGAPFYVLNKDDCHGRWWTAEADARRPLGARHTLAVGAEYRDNVEQRLRNYDVDPFLLYSDVQTDSRPWALYAEDEIILHRLLRLDVGVRHDHYAVFGSSTNPRAGLIFAPGERTSLKLLYGSAFRIPTVYELYYTDNGYTANEDLKPETIHTGELVFESRFARRYRLVASLFQYRVHGLMADAPDLENGTLQFQNGSLVYSTGGEAEVAGTWRNGLDARLSYAHQEAEDRTTGERLYNSPQDVAQLCSSASLVPGWLRAGLDLQFLGRRRTLAGAEAPAYLLTNVTLTGGPQGGRWEVTAGVFDAFDTRYADPGSHEHVMDLIGQVGRTARLVLRTRL